MNKTMARKIAKEIAKHFGTKVEVCEWTCKYILELQDEVGEEELETIVRAHNCEYLVEGGSMVSLYK